MTILELYAVIRQMNYSNAHSTASKMSAATVGQQAILDAFMSLRHLTVGNTVGAFPLASSIFYC